MLEVRGVEGAEDPMEAAQRYLKSVSVSVQSRALVAGTRAYLVTLRRAAMGSAPTATFRVAGGYRMAARSRRPGIATGYLYSAGFGNIIEGGAGGHLAPMDDEIKDDGRVWPGLRRWLSQHAPDLLARLGDKAKAMKIATRGGQPWVIPVASGAEQAAAEAFLEAVINSVQKEVTSNG